MSIICLRIYLLPNSFEKNSKICKYYYYRIKKQYSDRISLKNMSVARIKEKTLIFEKVLYFINLVEKLPQA